MSKIYVVCTRLLDPVKGRSGEFHLKEDIEDIFDSEEKAIKYVQDAMQECIDDPEPFNERGYMVLIKYVPEADSICENYYELCCKHISGALLSIGYRMYELK